METIDGTLIKILYHQINRNHPAGVPFLIGRLLDGRTVKGEMLEPVEDEQYRFWGDMRPQKGKYGDAFEFHSCEPIIPQSSEGVSTYLRNHVKGLGAIRSAALVNHFGADLLTVLRETPERAMEVKGITDGIVASIKAHFEQSRIDPVAYAQLVEMFAGHKIPRRVITSLMKSYNSDAPRKVRENPYILLTFSRVGWKTADSLALSVLGYDAGGLERHKAAIVESLERLADQGHTYARLPELDAIASPLLGGRPRWDTLAILRESGEIVIDVSLDEPDPEDAPYSVLYSLSPLWAAEDTIADRLALLGESARPIDFDTDISGLSDEQRSALETIRDNGVALLIGPPGTGKTFTITTLISQLLEQGIRSIRVCAPTGKAAKRAAELLARLPRGGTVPSTTIHKALGPIPNDAPDGVPADDSRVGRGREPFRFSRNENSPLEVDFLVVDESSMIDVKLGASLLKAIAPGTRVVFVGDENQLPSVGPGSVLRDLIAGGIPTARLSEIRRSDGGGRVVRACHAIKDGQVPQPAPRLELPTENWRHIELSHPQAIAEQIVSLVGPGLAGRFGLDPMWDIQVISPQKNKLVGCNNLNRLLSAKLNPPPLGGRDGPGGEADDGAIAEDFDPDREPPFRVGDKIIRTKNGLCDGMHLSSIFERPDWTWQGRTYQFIPCEVVNGDMGTIEDIITPDISGDRQTWVVVRFRTPERLARLAWNECYLSQAYCITVHKSQGSGFPLVIVPIHSSFYFDDKTGQGLFNRELVYTAISRSEQVLITVGEWGAMRKAISRRTIHRRRTRLAGLVRDALDDVSEMAGFGVVRSGTAG